MDRSLPRRTVLAAGAATLVAGVSGCALNNPFSDATTPAKEAVPDLSPDVGLAVTAAAAIQEQVDLLRATTTAYPRLAPALDAYLPMHRAHLAALADAVPAHVDISPTRTPQVSTGNLAAVRATALAGEHRLHDTFTALALRADSGAFARLLGSMAAAVSQRVAVGSR